MLQTIFHCLKQPPHPQWVVRGVLLVPITAAQQRTTASNYGQKNSRILYQVVVEELKIRIIGGIGERTNQHQNRNHSCTRHAAGNGHTHHPSTSSSCVVAHLLGLTGTFFRHDSILLAAFQQYSVQNDAVVRLSQLLGWLKLVLLLALLASKLLAAINSLLCRGVEWNFESVEPSQAAMVGSLLSSSVCRLFSTAAPAFQPRFVRERISLLAVRFDFFVSLSSSICRTISSMFAVSRRIVDFDTRLKV